MKIKTIVFLLALVLLPALAHADAWIWNYTGDDEASGTTNPGQYTPWVGGQASCSAPYYGQLIGNFFRWPNPCTHYFTYNMLSIAVSSRPDGLDDSIQQTGWLTWASRTIASVSYDIACSYGTDEVFNEGTCDGN
jgi:hypothetical protein